MNAANGAGQMAHAMASEFAMANAVQKAAADRMETAAPKVGDDLLAAMASADVDPTVVVPRRSDVVLPDGPTVCAARKSGGRKEEVGLDRWIEVRKVNVARWRETAAVRSQISKRFSSGSIRMATTC